MMAERDMREANIDQIARYINGMQPEKAVANLLQMDDQDIIDVLRAVEAIAKSEQDFFRCILVLADAGESRCRYSA